MRGGGAVNGPDRGAWYAAFELPTAQARSPSTKASSSPRWAGRRRASPYEDYRVDFSAELHDIRGSRNFNRCLDPASYVASQELAQQLLAEGALGIVYPSVRRPKGTCLACFRPALVMNVRKDKTYRFSWNKAGKLKIAIVG
ncbi:RES family NAD+ phosphorylase [Dongia deserti]|uniref:RES family NAD+ phosphorylase n=1 Tax=Dongia deserti TaxID=2268030 RepID=UPI0025482BCB|nr:RES family NAD+ phosphorylase [Dongia deserti]